MRKDIKAKWIKALRSGKYAQGKGQLHTGDKFCCLGVLCDLHAKATGQTWDGARYDGEDLMLPISVANWARLPKKYRGSASDRTDVYFSDEHESLSELNDGGKSFKEIAAVIKEKL